MNKQRMAKVCPNIQAIPGCALALNDGFVVPHGERFGICEAIIVYSVTTMVVFDAVLFSVMFCGRLSHPEINSPGLMQGLSGWDGVWYQRIVDHGYSYDSGVRSSVAFFPLYPLAGTLVRSFTSLPADCALLLVSQISLLASFIFFSKYIICRGLQPAESSVALLAFGLWPTTFFWRMTYTESLFVLLLVLVLLGLRQNWPILIVALLVGAATATRATGVALALPFAYHVWTTYRHSTLKLISRGLVFGCLSCWGLVAWMAYQQIQFGTPFAFMNTQAHWGIRTTLPFTERLFSLVIGEPIWSVYVPSSPAYWARFEPANVPALFSLQFANPIFVLIAVGLVILGARRGWLNTHEILLSAGLLLIPYVTHSYQTVMMGQGRYASVVIPVYIVMGRLLAQCPPMLRSLLFAMSACMLAAYSALFAAWYRMI